MSVTTVDFQSLLEDDTNVLNISQYDPIFKDIIIKRDCRELNNVVETYPISKNIVNFRIANHYVALVICILGVVFNTLLIAVLRKPKMRSSTNIIMIGLAAADQIMMISYAIYIIYFRLIYSPLMEMFQSSWAVQWLYVILYHYVYACSHVLSEWFTLAIAIVRYRACTPRPPPRDLNQRQAKLILIAMSFGCFLIFIPTFIYFTVVKSTNTPCYKISHSDVIPNFHKFWFWFVFITYRILPNSLLLVFTTLILWELKKISHQRRVTLGNRNCRQEIWATKMLLSIVLCTIISEIPKLVMLLVYRASYDESDTESHDSYMEKVESYLLQKSVLNCFEMFILLDSCINFVIYCTMSKSFRETFKKMFLGEREENGNSWFSGVSQTTRNNMDSINSPQEMQLLAQHTNNRIV